MLPQGSERAQCSPGPDDAPHCPPGLGEGPVPAMGDHDPGGLWGEGQRVHRRPCSGRGEGQGAGAEGRGRDRGRDRDKDRGRGRHRGRHRGKGRGRHRVRGRVELGP